MAETRQVRPYYIGRYIVISGNLNEGDRQAETSPLQQRSSLTPQIDCRDPTGSDVHGIASHHNRPVWDLAPGGYCSIYHSDTYLSILRHPFQSYYYSSIARST